MVHALVGFTGINRVVTGFAETTKSLATNALALDVYTSYLSAVTPVIFSVSTADLTTTMADITPVRAVNVVGMTSK